MQLVIGPDGRARAIYSECIDLATLGPLTIYRASHVEPTLDGRWIADLRPMLGPAIGPFPCRSDALAAEVAWLERHWLLPPG